MSEVTAEAAPRPARWYKLDSALGWLTPSEHCAREQATQAAVPRDSHAASNTAPDQVLMFPLDPSRVIGPWDADNAVSGICPSSAGGVHVVPDLVIIGLAITLEPVTRSSSSSAPTRPSGKGSPSSSAGQPAWWR